MGLFGDLLGKKAQLPPLDPTTPAAARLAKFEGQLGSFAGKVKDKLEAVPTDESLYLFIGKPPSAFGVAWFDGEREYNFKSLMDEKGLSPQRVQQLSDKLRDAYRRHRDDPRFMTRLSDKAITVTPSDGLAEDITHILGEVI